MENKLSSFHEQSRINFLGFPHLDDWAHIEASGDNHTLKVYYFSVDLQNSLRPQNWHIIYILLLSLQMDTA